jgi:Fe-S cluster assembly protein SufD
MSAIDTVNSYQADFERVQQARRGGLEWLDTLRRDAFARFTALGFPTTRQEEWRFTNVAPIADKSLRLSLAPSAVRKEQLAPHSLAHAGIDEIVVVNGRFVPALSSIGAFPPGALVGGLAEALQSGNAARLAAHLGKYAGVEGQAFTSLNTAFLTDGALVEVPVNAVLERPIHVLFVSAPDPSEPRAVVHPRLLVLAGRNSQLRLVESYVHLEGEQAGPARAWLTNAVSEIALEDGAVVDHYRIQRERRDGFHVSAAQVQLAHSSTFSSHAFTFGGGLVRQDVNVVLAGEGADCTLNGLYLADGTRLVDNHTFIDHARPHCTSHELFKGVLGDRARAVFNGKILVRPDAQKTDAKQTNKTLLLSDDAQINTKPQLEIYANDVKCTHGATVGQLSEDALFYLQARGIGRDAARQMLIRAFAGDITGRVRIDAVREALDGWMLAMLEGR